MTGILLKLLQKNSKSIFSPSQSNAWKLYFVFSRFMSENVHSSTSKGTVRNLNEKVKVKMK